MPENQDVAERFMDLVELEREKGITTLAKNTAISLGETEGKRRVVKLSD